MKSGRVIAGTFNKFQIQAPTYRSTAQATQLCSKRWWNLHQMLHTDGSMGSVEDCNLQICCQDDMSTPNMERTSMRLILDAWQAKIQEAGLTGETTCITGILWFFVLSWHSYSHLHMESAEETLAKVFHKPTGPSWCSTEYVRAGICDCFKVAAITHLLSAKDTVGPFMSTK